MPELKARVSDVNPAILPDGKNIPPEIWGLVGEILERGDFDFFKDHSDDADIYFHRVDKRSIGEILLKEASDQKSEEILKIIKRSFEYFVQEFGFSPSSQLALQSKFQMEMLENREKNKESQETDLTSADAARASETKVVELRGRQYTKSTGKGPNGDSAAPNWPPQKTKIEKIPASEPKAVPEAVSTEESGVASIKEPESPAEQASGLVRSVSGYFDDTDQTKSDATEASQETSSEVSVIESDHDSKTTIESSSLSSEQRRQPSRQAQPQHQNRPQQPQEGENRPRNLSLRQRFSRLLNNFAQRVRSRTARVAPDHQPPAQDQAAAATLAPGQAQVPAPQRPAPATHPHSSRGIEDDEIERGA